MKVLLFFACLICGTLRLSGQPIHRDIAIKITPYNNVTVYLANYYGNGKIFADTAWLDQKSEGHFKGKKKLTPGMYFVVSPKNKVLFEFLLDSLQQFSISADTTALNNVVITGSPENDLFKKYVSNVTGLAQQIGVLNQALAAAKTPAERQNVNGQLVLLDVQLQKIKDSFIQAAPNSLNTLLLNAGNQPSLPAGMTIKTHADTLRAGQYIKKHYWDNTPFNDDRLLYTPFFEPKIDAYFKYYVSPVADSVIKEVQYMLLYARTGKEMYPYLTVKFTNRYFNPEHIGQNKVFLYLFNEFLMRGDTALFNPQSKKMIFDRAYQLMANQVGDPAPPLEMTDGSGQSRSLYNLSAPYTMVIFWDPSCSHCQHEVPRIDSIYRAKWKAMGVKLFSVNINASLMNDMLKFAKDKNLDDSWIFAYQTDAQAKAVIESGKPNYHQLYDIYETPTIYLLDAQKHIIAKHLSIEQLDALIKVKNAIKK